MPDLVPINTSDNYDNGYGSPSQQGVAVINHHLQPVSNSPGIRAAIRNDFDQTEVGVLASAPRQKETVVQNVKYVLHRGDSNAKCTCATFKEAVENYKMYAAAGFDTEGIEITEVLA